MNILGKLIGALLGFLLFRNAFGIVLGLLAWLFLQAEVTLYAAEVDVVCDAELGG